MHESGDISVRHVGFEDAVSSLRAVNCRDYVYFHLVDTQVPHWEMCGAKPETVAEFRCPSGTRLSARRVVPPVELADYYRRSLRDRRTPAPRILQQCFRRFVPTVRCRKSTDCGSAPRPAVPEGPSDNSPAFLTPGRLRGNGTASRMGRLNHPADSRVYSRPGGTSENSPAFPTPGPLADNGTASRRDA